MERDAVLAEAREAKAAGAGRFCMGAAWKGVREGEAKFESVLNIVRDVKQLGMEVCVTLGQLTDEAARQLKDAGVTAYNHNLDTSPDHYRNIVTTHSFEDRLRTIRSVQKAGMAVCCGAILGMGETEDDRLKMLEVLCGFDPRLKVFRSTVSCPRRALHLQTKNLSMCSNWSDSSLRLVLPFLGLESD